MGEGDVIVECISPRFIKFRIDLESKLNGVCISLDEVVRGVHSRDYILLLMNANTRKGMRAIRRTDRNVLGGYRRETNRTTTESDY